MDVVLGILLVLLLLAVIAGGLWLLAIRGNPGKPDFYGLSGWRFAHRGLHDGARGVPENSLRAFRLAVRNGCGAELDVHLSRDKRLVVMHDESLLRTAGLDKNIGEVTAKTLDTLRLEGTGEKIPYLEEVLPLFEGVAPLVVEIKPVNGNYARLTYRVCKLLDRYPGLTYCMESFDPRVLIWLRKNRPEIVRGQLSQSFLKDRAGLKWLSAFLMTNLLLNWLTKPDFVAYRTDHRRNPALRLCRKLWKVQEFDWTVKSQRLLEELERDNAIAIFEGFTPSAPSP